MTSTTLNLLFSLCFIGAVDLYFENPSICTNTSISFFPETRKTQLMVIGTLLLRHISIVSVCHTLEIAGERVHTSTFFTIANFI